MSDHGSSVTLIFYAIDRKNITSEPLLNIIAAAAQWSAFTHVEVAIGENAGAGGQMSNVLRVFNDDVGCELTQRTGKNPSYSYLQLGCSKRAEAAMLQFGRQQIGKPFSGTGMARSLIWPRTPDGSSWFCAELVAACLQAGGLLNRDSNPGAATPQSLYRLYKGQAAAAANPYTLRNQFASTPGRAQSAPRMRPMPAAAPVFSTPLRCASASALPSGGAGTSVPRPAPLAAPIRVNDSWRSTRPSEPPRAGLRVVHAGSQPSHVDKTLTLSLNSLNFRPKQ